MLIILFLAAQLSNRPPPQPSFGSYKVFDIFKGTPAEPQLKTAGQRRFRTKIRDAAKTGPNFAGHYCIAEWGCGAGCASMALIDVQSGAVYDGPFGALPYATVDFSLIDAVSAGFTYHIDSRLFVVHGCPNGKNCGAYYYKWTGSDFRLLHFIRELKQ